MSNIFLYIVIPVTDTVQNNLLLLWFPSVVLLLPQDQLLLAFSLLVLTPTYFVVLKQRRTKQVLKSVLFYTHHFEYIYIIVNLLLYESAGTTKVCVTGLNVMLRKYYSAVVTKYHRPKYTACDQV